MNSDIVIYNTETRDIIAIITDASLKNSIAIAIDGLAIEEVDNTKPYIIKNTITGEAKYKNQNNNLLYLDDFRQGGNR